MKENNISKHRFRSKELICNECGTPSDYWVDGDDIIRILPCECVQRTLDDLKYLKDAIETISNFFKKEVKV